MKVWDIVGYTYNADTYCPNCIGGAVADREYAAIDAPGAYHDAVGAEEELNALAGGLGIDREDESSFDSGDFPKVVFASQLGEDDEHCGACWRALEG